MDDRTSPGDPLPTVASMSSFPSESSASVGILASHSVLSLPSIAYHFNNDDEKARSVTRSSPKIL